MNGNRVMVRCRQTKYFRKKPVSPPLSTTYCTWTAYGANPHLQVEKWVAEM